MNGIYVLEFGNACFLFSPSWVGMTLHNEVIPTTVPCPRKSGPQNNNGILYGAELNKVMLFTYM